jgi:glycine/D-amino acid oxidase-like deaminating enzyme
MSDVMAIPSHAKYVIIGAGIHGLSTAFHLAQELTHRGTGSGKDILVVDKSGICAGATGIACGVIRNNYYQPAMRELMAHSVKIWESDPDTYSYHPVGYMQISCESMHQDVASIYQQQQAIGYDSTFVEGAEDCTRYMRSLFSDWRAEGITSVLHEKPGGYGNHRCRDRQGRDWLRLLRRGCRPLGAPPVVHVGAADGGRDSKSRHWGD